MNEGAGERERGRTLVELLAALALSGLLLGAATPSLSGIYERSRMKGASREIETLVRTLRTRALAEGRSVGIAFERGSAAWTYTIVADGDGDGIRSEDIVSGVDAPLGPAERLGERWPGVDFGFQDLPRVRRVPPSTGWLGSLDDPVQFGSSDIVSFSPRGQGSSGTFYLTDRRAQMAAIVVYGPTGRVRLFRYDQAAEQWTM